MAAKTPSEVHQLFVRYFKSGQIDSLVALYEPAAVLLPQPGAPVDGHGPIRAALAEFLGLSGEFSMDPPALLECDGLALLYADWSLTGGKAPDGSIVNLSGRTSDLVRRQPDGSWLYAIDNPWGAEGFPAER